MQTMVLPAMLMTAVAVTRPMAGKVSRHKQGGGLVVESSGLSVDPQDNMGSVQMLGNVV